MHAASGAMAAVGPAAGSAFVGGGSLVKNRRDINKRKVFGGNDNNNNSTRRRLVTVREYPAAAAATSSSAAVAFSSSASLGGGGGRCVVTGDRSSVLFLTPRTRSRRRGKLLGVRLAASSSSSRGGEVAAAAGAAVGWRQYASVACVMLAVFLHLLGFTVTGPITPGLVSHFGLHPSEVGYLTSAYPLGMFFALFAWPRMSDRVQSQPFTRRPYRRGRKPILVLSLLGVGCGLVAQASCVARDWSLTTFLALRVASGAFAGASPVVKAYLADAATPEQLPSFMAWREAACTLAFIVGPTLGGLLFTGSSLSACISVTGWASVAAAALVAVVMQESRPQEEETTAGSGIGGGGGAANGAAAATTDDVGLGRSSAADAAAEEAGAREAATAILCPLGRGLVAAVATICVTSFLYNAGQSTFDSFFPVYSSEVLGLGPRQIGGWLTALAAVSFSVSAVGFASAQKAWGLTATAVLGLTLISAGLTLIGLAPGTDLAMAAAVLYVAGIPLFTPAVPILLMQCVPANKRGAVMGLDSAVNSVARIFTPILFGKLYHQNPTVCFVAGGCVVAAAAIVVVVRRLMVLGSGATSKGWVVPGSK